MAAGIESERAYAVDTDPSGAAPRARAGGPVRVAVIGCGAVAREFHLPVLAGHEGVRLAALVDRDLARAGELARAYGVGRVVTDAAELADGEIDAALVATPPAHHAPCSIALAGRGIHILVEKPMALALGEAEAMVRAAQAARVVLAVGLFRRLLPGARLLRAAIEGGALGRPIGFDIECGGVYGWASATLGNMRKELAGGGVLIDMGSHVIDQLLFFLPGPAEVEDYRDDSLGGIEADCELRLRIDHGGSPLAGRIALSRTRELRNTVRIDCERGALELPFGENDRVTVRPRGVALADPASGAPRPYDLRASWAGVPSTSGYEAFRAEVDDWLEAIRSGRPPQLDGRSALPTVRLIEDCYRRARPLREPWVEEGLRRGGGTGPDPVAGARIDALPRSRGRVLVTGAAGFIGCRAAEVLQLGEGWQVRSLVHRPGGAARLARLPVELVPGDLKSREDMARAVQGCDAVVHCAIGTAYGQRREIFAVTVEGTRHLVEAARAAGVRRFVHLSSIAVHGTGVQGVLDEATPIRPRRGGDYSESKAAAERIVARAARAGLPAVILRAGNVYGPFGRTLSIRPIQYLRRGRLVLAGAADSPSNTVYVDNLVHAIVRALGAQAEVADGRAFTIGEGDELTWGEFYGFFARALGAELRTALPEPAGPRPVGGPLGWARAWWRGGTAVLTSPEFRALGHRVLRTDPLGRLPRHLLQRHPGLERRLHRQLGTDAAVIYRRPPGDAEDLLTIGPSPGRIRVDEARRLLGYAPPVPRQRAMELTLEWLRHARLA